MKLKRIFALALSILVGVSALGSMAVPASAEEIQETDAYVLTYDGAVEGYEYGSLPYMYKSPFRMYHSYDDTSAGGNSSWKYYYTNEIFQLVNTSKLKEGGTGAYASIPVYCTDVDTSTRESTTYRRINLEDSTYHASGAAARLRAVILNSFPYIQDMSVITAAANTWLEANGEKAIENLQIGEAMLATQQAIWEITHGDSYTVLEPFTECGTYDGSDAVYTINSEEKATNNTKDNITGLYQYFLSLDGMAPQDDAVSEYTFENVTYHVVKEENGTYTITAEFDVNTTVDSGDQLTLSASCNGEVKSVALLQGGTYSFTFEGMTEQKEINLQINGYQTGGDVYLFDSEGDRSNAQSMIGYDNSCLPVHGEATASPDRVINILKTTSADEGKEPLANIEFELYKVASMAQLESGEVILSEKPTAEEIETYKVSENLITVLKTDIQGLATYNFTENGQPDGVYMIVERYSAATTGPVEPFFIIVPGTTESGDGYVYTITVNPKNTTETGPDIQKDVTKLDNDHDSYDVDELHTWIIRAGVPAGIGTAQKYIITDTIDYRLTYTKGSPVVKLFTKAGEELTLTPDAYFILKEGTVEENGRAVDLFSISLTAEGMAYVAENLGSGSHIPEIRVYFTAAINSNASLGEEIPNDAHLDYTNSAGVDYDADSDVPEVHTGGTNIRKTDAKENPLAGASFKIAREATEEELADDTITKEILTVDGEPLNVVFVDFYATGDLSGEKTYEVTTNENGAAVIYGLAYGTYYIVETQSPAGYNLLTAPIKVEINAESHLEANSIKVINTKFVMPETGGIGTTVFTVTGLVIIGAAVLLLVFNAKKRKA